MWNIDSSWTLFLDRDGVINQRIMDDYVKTIEEFIFLNEVPEAIVHFSKIFGRIVVVTNQQGIGKGLMTESNLSAVHTYMIQEIEKLGGRIDAVYFAPQLAKENSAMRKPEGGMALKAKSEFPEIDFSKSVMVGDSDSDIEFGKRLGMKTVKISPTKMDDSKADLYVERLNQLAKSLKHG
jgi:histidinol-phosphate phosphatase family protein